MRILLVGAGGVGGAFTAIAARRDFFEALVIADYDQSRAERAAATDDRYVAAQIDASSADAVAALCREHAITHVMNAVDPVFNMPIFEGASAAGADYLDMAMSLSKPHPEAPYEKTGVKLGDEQFAVADQWESADRLALVGIGVEPGLSDVFARYAADHLFSEIDELGTRDGANLVVTDDDGNEIFAPSFSMWTTIEECLNPPVIWAGDGSGAGDWHTTPPFSEPEVFDFPEGIGPVECVNVEHEEVLLMPRWVDCKRATFKYGLGEEMINILRVLHTLGLDSTEKVRVKGVEVSPRDVVAAVLPDPATIGPRMTGKTCAGLWVTGKGKDGQPRSTYLYHVVDNEWTMREYGHQCVVWQTAINPVVALELLARGTWSGAGVLGPEAFDAVPFLELLTEYGSPWGMQEVSG
ncbi:MAG TPA: saccharopine dehydrogenase C-terminal domain-containing protein [Nocardioides sp.]|uniref:saccharopine dehydrogenase family protein n=1 Tax=uncultured Nocardioides sp. TaxID=198441 RepID=UPI000ED89FCB|nr:saccharopine dehydrogenase C-terminal domain-containing protein [uncultured Nocardioides sp.]HCB05248.1 ATP-binding protein [Nocardioides sp.]HRD62495.1 saccharopine dehydrogenase C-terminal domain-containing protein [Nocardioides sp.]HRI95508.1 saccharopine dehydrogenase C-terminal domain-containing protein [Nocardioides sp.]HRK45405.1 saccharopine dehydrogenase C-terminal domain-containing protein [Nocardioides sp.]